MSAVIFSLDHSHAVRYDTLTDHQRHQVDHILDLLDPVYGLTDTDQRRVVSEIGARAIGIDLAPGTDLARCQGADGTCPVVTASDALHETTHANLCPDCHDAYLRLVGE
ncbi:hypothetical protein OG618_37375 (plasmid) [Kitasatospora sp. NBC_01246]|uniref:hypothetical protein n=1 Tax=Kitasatospora sp. NBC_01246 TaxID=2903570 RepID=UPI002E35BE09|nr:hypothetical protein [Kitasatospora sp. NBC_01246]